ncbi:hypothetical protein PMIT1342_02113 [Prochlorococcus marinus str. MIT 1342]|uniref:hypothetical protein n=1 Tax=Prochlorococcus TaxID=1218 RepID=UPI0007B365A5|nr:hypothetical protein [Prochlorococcus marinus]KZR80166.1 hypothetical protein PMIT1342_02113 [Prochlorococcus marinus str. MIT 1342]
MKLGKRFLWLILLQGFISPAFSASLKQATIQRIVDGNEVYIDKNQARVKQSAKEGQQISTGNSRTELLFDRRALGYLGKNSLINLGEDCFSLSNGSVLINGTQRSCIGSKVLGIRGTTYVLSINEVGSYDLAVLTGEAQISGKSKAGLLNEPDADILTLYPRLNPVIGIGGTIWGNNANNSDFEGLILGDLAYFQPLSQNSGSSVLYSLTSSSSNFDTAWGVSQEFGYRWFDPNNQRSNGVMAGYTHWQGQIKDSCSRSQLSLGVETERNRWKLAAAGGVPVDNCESQFSFASATVGMPIAEIDQEPITLSLSPYLLAGIGKNYAGGRVGLNIPIGPRFNLFTYGSYDGISETTIGGKISYRFPTGGSFVEAPAIFKDDETLRTEVAQSKQSKNTKLRFASIGKISTPCDSGPVKSLINDAYVIKAGEQVRIDPNGTILSCMKMTPKYYTQLIIKHIKGQTPPPESTVIAKTFNELLSNTPAPIAPPPKKQTYGRGIYLTLGTNENGTPIINSNSILSSKDEQPFGDINQLIETSDTIQTELNQSKESKNKNTNKDQSSKNNENEDSDKDSDKASKNSSSDNSDKTSKDNFKDDSDDTSTNNSDDTSTNNSDDTSTNNSDDTSTNDSDDTSTNNSDYSSTNDSDDTSTNDSDDTSTNNSDYSSRNASSDDTSNQATNTRTSTNTNTRTITSNTPAINTRTTTNIR